MDINFELYKVFYQVAKHLSFSQASEQLFISQSAVSQAINSLEVKLQCKLFFRTTKQVKLTPEGQQLFNHIEQAFNSIKAGERTLEGLHSLTQGEVRIGASDTICKHYLLPFLQSFNQLYPQIKINITNRTSMRCLELLRQGNVDLAVINLLEKDQIDQQFKVTPVRSVQDVFIAGGTFTHLAAKPLSLQELTQYPLLMLEKNSSTRKFFDSLLAKYNLQTVPEIELGSLDLMVELTKMGLGISFAVQDFLPEDLEAQGLVVLKTTEPIRPRQLALVTHKHIPLAATKFAELLKTQEN